MCYGNYRIIFTLSDLFNDKDNEFNRMKKKLTPKQELFCNLFATDRDCFGNGTQAYLKAFSTEKIPIPYKTAKTQASLLLTNPNLTERIRKLMDVFISNEVVDAELAAVILQWADISSKVSAVREYNKVKGRVTDKIEHSGEITNIKVESKDLESFIAWRKKYNK